MLEPFATIAYFAFRRPLHTRRSLESLAANALAKESRLMAYIDGPSNEQDERLSDEVEEIVRSERWCGKVEVVRRAKNLGCAASTIEVMSDLTDRFDRVICLEDDNLLSPFFLEFMNQGFSRFANEDRVMEITGYRYPLPTAVPRSGFLGASVGWGWGTWRRAWTQFNPDGRDLRERLAVDKDASRRFGMAGASNGAELLEAQIAGKIGGWDVRWAASIALADGLTLYPARPLSANIGHDGSGINCGVTDLFHTIVSPSSVEDFPSRIAETIEYRRALKHFFIVARGGYAKHLLRGVKRSFTGRATNA